MNLSSQFQIDCCLNLRKLETEALGWQGNEDSKGKKLMFRKGKCRKTRAKTIFTSQIS
jgi:hypothetical protein